MIKKFPFFITIIALCFASCSPRINPEKPHLAETRFNIDSLPASEINIPIRVNLKPVYAMAEKSVDTIFTSPNYPDDWVEETCDSRYKYIFRRGPLQMTSSGNSFNLGFTGYYRIIGSTRVCVAGTAISPWTPPCRCGFNEGERKVNVSFSNTVNILNDYKLKLSFKRNEPQPLDKCEVCFWGQDITGQVIKGLTSELDLAKTELEKSYGTIDLRPKFQQLWDQLNKVYNLYNTGWLSIHPQSIRLTELKAMNDSLYIGFGLQAKPVVTLEKPAEQSSWIPPLTGARKSNNFNIYLDAVLDYDSLSNILNKKIAGQTFDLDKGPVRKKFVFKSAQLYGASNEKMVVRVEFGGTDNGIFYLTGRPSYDAATKILELKDIDFDIKSKDALLKAADWLFNRKIITEISKYARYDLTSFIETAKSSMSQQMNREWMPGITSSAQINDISFVAFYPFTRHLVVRTNCNGTLQIKVDSIPFSF